jgi:LAGLIDADG endonuclease
VGSNPIASTRFLELLFPWRTIGFTLGGFVAGEGWFTAKSRGARFVTTGAERRRFVFGVTVASRDRPVLEALQQFLGCGNIRDQPSKNERWLPESTLEVVAIKDHLTATIPFAEEFLLPCQKRTQFEVWRDQFLTYERDRPQPYPKPRSVCRIAGCTGLVRGRMLCRRHYYLETGY